MSNRAFGVEIEHSYEHYTHGTALYKCEEILRGLRGRIGSHWINSLHHDGSGAETCSPVLQGKTGFAELKLVMNTIAAAGGRCTASDGMHVHFDVPELNTGNAEENSHNAMRLARSWKNNEREIYSFVEQRRHTSGACSPFPRASIANPLYAPTRYALNFSNAVYRGYYAPTGRNAFRPHVEVRLHHGTVDFTEAEAWIRFMQKFIDGVFNRVNPLRCAEDPIVLLKRVRTPKRATVVLANKIGVAA